MGITENTGFSETFFFLLRLHFGKRKIDTSLDNYSILLSSAGITFQNKEKYSTQYNYSILQFEYFFLTNFTMTQVCTHTSWLPMTKYKLVIPIKGIMILVFWEKSFKSLEADYSNHLARSLVASCREISTSP